jgi:uncharacterized protein YuzE
MDTANQNFLDKLEREHAAYLRRIMAANGDFAERATTLGARAEYDRDQDTLSISIGPAVEASAESIDNRVFISVDPETLKIVGIDVMGLRDLLVAPSPDAEPLARALEPIAAALLVDEQRPSPSAVEALARTMRQLVPA